jgi:hypothetical protein
MTNTSKYRMFKILNSPLSPPPVGRCQALTQRRNQCHRLATIYMHQHDLHQVCDLHWEYPPREWW